MLGVNTEEEALSLKEDVINLMSMGGFEKASNNQDVLNAVPSYHHGTLLQFCPEDQQFCNSSGIKWIPEAGNFSYTVTMADLPPTIKAVLSEIAPLYETKGWLTFIIFLAKELMQVLWTKGLQ